MPKPVLVSSRFSPNRWPLPYSRICRTQCDWNPAGADGAPTCWWREYPFISNNSSTTMNISFNFSTTSASPTPKNYLLSVR
jgi:hypothetical protein